MVRPRLSDDVQRDIENSVSNQREAFRLLDLIDAEFQSDPTSVQCFDLRIVQQVRECVSKHKEFVRKYPIYAL